jgi:ATP-dependent Clp protease adaptor protein ClpS
MRLASGTLTFHGCCHLHVAFDCGTAGLGYHAHMIDWSATTQQPGTIQVDETDAKTALQRPWNVIVLNDPINLMSYVTMVFQRVFGYPRTKAEKLMMDVHRKGRALVWSGDREQAEMYVHQLQSYQLLAKMETSEP